MPLPLPLYILPVRAHSALNLIFVPPVIWQGPVVGTHDSGPWEALGSPPRGKTGAPGLGLAGDGGVGGMTLPSQAV